MQVEVWACPEGENHACFSKNRVLASGFKLDLEFSEAQQMLKSSVAEFLSRECSLQSIRSMAQYRKGCSEEMWQDITKMGWLGLPFPEQYGGAGGNFMDLAALLEETGRALAPGPIFSTVVLGGLTILTDANETRKNQLIPPIISGETVATVALVEPHGDFDAKNVNMEASLIGNEWLVNGTKLFVPDALSADILITAVRTSESSDPENGVTVLLIPGSCRGVSIVPHKTEGVDKLAEVRFDSVRIPDSDILGHVGEGWPIMRRMLERAAAAKCVEMSGGAQAVLRMTLDHLKRRVQFGRPIGAFQSMQHHAADMATYVEGCRYISYQAAWKVAQGLPAPIEVSMAKAWVSDIYQKVCALAHECHGAIGFTREYDLQMYTHRANAQGQIFGDARFHRELVARMAVERSTLL